MNFLKTAFLIAVLLLNIKYSYAYEKLEFFDNFYIYTPYIYIMQDEPVIEKIKILVLFHDIDNPKKKKLEVGGFVKEALRWEYKSEKERLFIMGYDFGDYKKLIEKKENLDSVNDRILREISRLKRTCNPKEIQVYVAGTGFGGDLALLFNLMYDTFDGAFCMNMLKPVKDTEKYLDNCDSKNFYFYIPLKNKSMDIDKMIALKSKLLKGGATAAEIKVYKKPKKTLHYKAYLDAIDKIGKK
ncbi:hypothetical protein [Candidatus Ruminimicrobiellum ovillum]|uniref:hypothetical protein n=1 Tax=Candidatus Ruminimicrobiellum ovillum TaxID=1947927 RepID=UPI0035597CCE